MDRRALVFLGVLQVELESAAAAGAGSEAVRTICELASTEVTRHLVAEAELPRLRAEALVAYRDLLPAVRAHVTQAAAQDLELAFDSEDWDDGETALTAVLSELLSAGDRGALCVAAELTAVDARLRADYEQACRRPCESTAAGSRRRTPVTGTAEDKARLLEFLTAEFPRETQLTIGSITQISGGFSKHTLSIELANTVDLPPSLVMRRDGPFPGSSVVDEYAVIQKLFAAGVAVPQPFAVDATGETFGKPFILVSHVVGRAIGDSVTVREPSRQVALDLASKLARLHQVAVDGLEADLAGGTTSITQRLSAEIDTSATQWGGVVNRRSHVVPTAIDWLRRNIEVAEGPRAVLHRDVGFHNLLVHDQQIAAILDWETAAIGTPAEDVAFVFHTVEQMMDWDEFLDAYESDTGVVMDRAQLDFYKIWASVRILSTVAKNVDPVFDGTRKSLPQYYLGDHVVQILIQRLAGDLSEVLAGAPRPHSVRRVRRAPDGPQPHA